ncbi:MAG: hypothetical protein ACFFCW_46660, partial [Candidatus Hodarchaeota archaeon]
CAHPDLSQSLRDSRSIFLVIRLRLGFPALGATLGVNSEYIEGDNRDSGLISIQIDKMASFKNYLHLNIKGLEVWREGPIPTQTILI